MNINLIGVPLFFGCDKEGVQFGPNTLRENNLISLVQKYNHKAFDLGNLYVPKTETKDKYSSHEKMKYLSPIVEVNKNLAHQVYSSLECGNFPFVIGGDHSLGLGSISGASKFLDNLAVIWIDAHGDINTHETSPTGNVHGMPLAAAMGLGHEVLTDLYYQGRKINPENVYIIGARDLDEGEQDIIREFHLNVWTTEDVKNQGVHSILNKVLRKLNMDGIKNVHLSFDIDSLDANLVPGTGTPVQEGMDLDEVKAILEILLNSGLIRSMDFVEFNPLIDKNNKTLEIALDLLNLIFSNLK